MSASGTAEVYLMPDDKVCCVEDPMYGACFFFCPHVQLPAALYMFYPSHSNMARAFSHTALMQSILLTPIGSDPQSHTKRELVVLSPPCAGINNLYQVANDWWEEEDLSGHSTSFPLGP